jgi:hypothetical protein
VKLRAVAWLARRRCWARATLATLADYLEFMAGAYIGRDADV